MVGQWGPPPQVAVTAYEPTRLSLSAHHIDKSIGGNASFGATNSSMPLEQRHGSSSLKSPLIGNTSGNSLAKSCLTLPTPFQRRTTATASRAETSQTTSVSRASSIGRRRRINSAALGSSDDDDDDDKKDNTRKALWRGGASSSSSPLSLRKHGSYGDTKPAESRPSRTPSRIPSPSDALSNARKNTAGSGATSRRSINQLLTPPPTQDRSERRKYENSLRNSPMYNAPQSHPNSRRRRGLYEGELEPQGFRGQEATPPPSRSGGSARAVPQTPTGSTTSPLRLLPLVTPNGTLSHPRSSMHSVPEVSHESSSYDDGSDHQHQQQFKSAMSSTTIGPKSTQSHNRMSSQLPTQPELEHSEERRDPAHEHRSAQAYKQAAALSPLPLLKEISTISSSGGRRTSRLEPPPPSRIPQYRTTRRSMASASPAAMAAATTPTARPPPQSTHRPHSDGESTCSDEDINHMMADFLRPMPTTNNQTGAVGSHGSVTPNILHSPSAVQMNQRVASSSSSNNNRTLSAPAAPASDNDIPRIRSSNTASVPRSASVASSGFSSLSAQGTSSSARKTRSEFSTATTVPTGTKGGLPRSSHDNSTMGEGCQTMPVATKVGSSSTSDGLAEQVEQWQGEASAAVQRGDYDTALAAFTAVLQAQVQRFGGAPGRRTPHAAIAAAYHNLGTVHAKRATAHAQVADGDGELAVRQDRAAALECFQAAARCARDATPPDAAAPHPNVAVSLVRVGFLLLQAKQYQNAIITFSEALRIRLAVYGNKHALSANLYNNLGVCCLHMGEFARGLQHLEQALDIQRFLVQQHNGNGLNAVSASQSTAVGDPLTVHQLELADTLFNIGGLCLEWMRRQGPDSRRADQAVSAFEECLQLRALILGKKDPKTAQAAALHATALALPRPRRLVQTPVSSSSKTSTRGPAGSVDRRNLESTSNQLFKGRQNGISNHIVEQEPPQVKRSAQNAASLADDFPHSLSPIRSDALSSPLPSNAVHNGEDSNESSSIFRVAGGNNQSPLRQPTGNGHQARGVHSSGSSTLRGQQERHEDRTTPMLHITVSKDDVVEESDVVDSMNGGTRVYVAPQKLAPVANLRHGLNRSIDAVANELSHEKDGFALDTSNEETKSFVDKDLRQRQHPKPLFSSSYDAEENCLISDSGVDSEIGRIHYPLSWSRAGIQTSAEEPSPSRRDIVVARPVVMSQTENMIGDAMRSYPSQAAKNFVRVDSITSDRWGSETVNVSTGNKDRDDLLAKARAMLLAHAPESVTEDTSRPRTNPRKTTKRDPFMEQDMIEDGIAPLGGTQASKPAGEAPTSVREMLQDPMRHLHEIHEEATRLLKENNVVDAQRLFEVVLQCQRHRHGPLHPDVASALHNLGITQLRAQNHAEALKSFEEAARVRKGSLGKDHALVAVSLVKVGITLLLLHRFEEALWSFREALSVRKHALGALHPSTARIYNNIGCVYVEFNEFKEARRAFEAALDIQRSALCNDGDNFPLLFATATTLCNLGYLYRYRDMHAKAASVLAEASELQERVLGQSHSTVLSTIDNLADSCANSGNVTEALKYYNVVLGRFKAAGTDSFGNSKRQYRAEAVLLYKMSRVHRQLKDRGAQLSTLKLALQAIRQYSDTLSTTSGIQRTDTLERRIHYDMRSCREELEKEGLKWL